jgi:hypothetical protein
MLTDLHIHKKNHYIYVYTRIYIHLSYSGVVPENRNEELKVKTS